MALKIAKAAPAQSKPQFLQLATLAFERGDLVKAGEHLMSALEIDPTDAKTFLNVAMIRQRQGQLDKALIATTQGILLSPGDASAWNFMGVLLFELRCFGAAEKFFRRAVELDPDRQNIKESLLDAIRHHQQAGDDEPSEQLDAILKLLELGQRPTLSLCMIVKNEEQYLEACLTSVKDVVDEMVIVDTGSTDRTRAIAEGFGARILDFPWCDDFAAARNHGIEAAKGDWILILDADEEIAAESLKELRQILYQKQNGGYGLLLENDIGRDGHGGKHTAYIVRLFRNLPEFRYEGIIHEQVAPRIVASGMPSPFSGVKILHKGYADHVITSRSKLERNMALLVKQLAKEPENPYCHFHLGQTAKSMGDIVAAEGHYRNSLQRLKDQKVATNVPYYATCYAGLVDAIQLQRRFDEALTLLDEGLAHYPAYADMIYAKGQILLELSRFDEAIACFERCRTLKDTVATSGNDPDVPGYKALGGLAAVYARTGKLALARDYARRGVAECGRKSPEPLCNLAALALTMKDHAEAIRSAAQAIEIDPNWSKAWQALGTAFFEVGEHRDALEAFTRLLELGGEDPGVHYLVGECHLGQGQAEKARTAFERAAETASPAEAGQMGYKLAVCDLLSGSFQAAADRCRVSVEGAPADVAAKLKGTELLARHLAAGTTPSADELEPTGLPRDLIAKLWAGAFELAVRGSQGATLVPVVRWARDLAGAGFPELALEVGGVYVAAERWDHALEQLLLAMPHLEGNAELYHRIGVAAKGKELVEDARLMLQQALRLDPRHPRAGRVLASLPAPAPEVAAAVS